MLFVLNEILTLTISNFSTELPLESKIKITCARAYARVSGLILSKKAIGGYVFVYVVLLKIDCKQSRY